jgi:hypothetical protein
LGDSHRERISHHRAIVCVNLVIEVALHPAVHCETTRKLVDNPRRCSCGYDCLCANSGIRPGRLRFGSAWLWVTHLYSQPICQRDPLLDQKLWCVTTYTTCDGLLLPAQIVQGCATSKRSLRSIPGKEMKSWWVGVNYLHRGTDSDNRTRQRPYQRHQPPSRHCTRPSDLCSNTRACCQLHP